MRSGRRSSGLSSPRSATAPARAEVARLGEPAREAGAQQSAVGRSVAAVVLERDAQAHAVSRDRAVLDRDVLALHTAGTPLLLPNPWDAGSAKLLASLGFEALATTSSGFAATLGRVDGSVTRDEAIAHSAAIVAAAGLPVSADLENGFADDPADVAETVRLALGAGLAGCSI